MGLLLVSCDHIVLVQRCLRLQENSTPYTDIKKIVAQKRRETEDTEKQATSPCSGKGANPKIGP